MSDEPVIHAGCHFEGVLTFYGATRIDGRLSGKVVGRGALVISEGAEVLAEVSVDELVVAGTLGGSAHARQRIELLPTARVSGHLRAPRLAVADGCWFDGRCETAPAPMPEPPKSP